MNKIRKNIPKIIYIFILLSPFLDSITYLMREYLQLNISISTLLKPLILGIVFLLMLIYLIFYKKKKIWFLIPMLIIIIYSVVHFFIIKNLYFDFSYSTLIEEAKRMIQIIYLVMIMYIFYLLYKYKKDFNFDGNKLLKVLAISSIIYYTLYVLSLITGTSELTYENGVNLGFQGWLVPSHLINHIGALSIPLVWLQYKRTNKKIWLYCFGLMSALCFGFIGTKSSTLSVIIILLLIFVYEFINILFLYHKKKVYPLFIICILLIGCFVTYKYTLTFHNIKIMNGDLIKAEGTISDKLNNTLINIDIENEKVEIDKTEEKPDIKYNKKKEKDKERKQYINLVSSSIKNLERETIEKKLSGADNRNNQMIYNAYLFKNLGLKHQLFGTGFTNQPNNLYMENDLFSMLFNYGIIPFVMTIFTFILIFIYIFIKLFSIFIKGKLFHFEDIYMLMISISLFIVLTYKTGYMLIQTSLIIIFVPVFMHSLDTMKNHKDTIKINLRIRKYLSRIKRLKNKNSYNKELKAREKISIFDYQKLSEDLPVYYKELSKDNTLYGIANSFRKYCNYSKILDSYIEHGVNFSTSVYPSKAVNGLSNIIAISQKRIDIIHQNYEKKVYAVGPYIHYAPTLYDKKTYEKEKKELGKVLLVFPSKSIEGVNHVFDSKEFINEIKVIKNKIKADTVLINMYYFDIQQGLHKNFAKEGFKIVTAGHKNDINFTSRLKYIISLSDYTMSNNIGTHVGYCLYMEKPHYIYEQEIKITGEKSKEEFYEERLRTYNKSQAQILNVFSKFQNKITSEQKKIYQEHWDPDSIKTKKELLKILKDSEYRDYENC